MSDTIIAPVEVPKEKKKKTVSFSQFSNWWTCPAKWKLDYIDGLKTFEDSLHMTFGTGIHEAIQLFLRTLFDKGEEEAKLVDVEGEFIKVFKREVELKKIPHTQQEFNEFVEDGKAILEEFLDPSNRIFHFPRHKWDLIGIEVQIDETILNNVNLTAKLDIVFREKMTGNIRIVDFKTATSAWTSYKKEDFTKVSQLLIYKALYSKKYNIPLSKIHVEFFILVRKLYSNTQTRFKQSRLQIFKPNAYQKEITEVIGEFKKFVETCFTADGLHNTSQKYPKNPGKGKKNCEYCPHLKSKKCDGRAEPLE